ncbi:hypothetical protein Vqi01_25430 [Micromonospora qiuiae]|uniref:Uncharacterized protein n=1 Tax=Micromonospora qiuiae TaxID=502268 RepID=A0ABQ4JBJ3_9ACTN|nr:hypothetical protein [Micromonospora qiuiae]GIJ27381.1 hypothetical protein Vqi01_25430 [Micromonospora qiuiae]
MINPETAERVSLTHEKHFGKGPDGIGAFTGAATLASHRRAGGGAGLDAPGLVAPPEEPLRLLTCAAAGEVGVQQGDRSAA